METTFSYRLIGKHTHMLEKFLGQLEKNYCYFKIVSTSEFAFSVEAAQNFGGPDLKFLWYETDILVLIYYIYACRHTYYILKIFY